MENPFKMDDLGVPLFLETPIWANLKQIFPHGLGNHQLVIFQLMFRAFAASFTNPPPTKITSTKMAGIGIAGVHLKFLKIRGKRGTLMP